MPPQNQNPLPATGLPPIRKRRPWVSLTILALALLLIVVIVIDRQPIQDWIRLRGYRAPSSIAQLAAQDTMTAYTRHLFYLNKPQLLSTVTAFRQDCPENENTIVLGCYHSDQNGIYIYNVADPTLAGVTQVTAAHEVLHAVYARLSNSARNQLNSELERFYKNDLKDPRVLAEVKLYQQTEPGSVMDEMSCTFGTEVANLPSALNDYYKKYFSNRLAVVVYEQQYQNAFTTRENTITADDQQLSTMKAQIDQQNMTLNGELANLNEQQSQMDALKASGQLDTYNADVPGYNAAVDDYNFGIANLQATITTYNNLVFTRNSVAANLTTLDKALDTRLTTQSTR
jgi:hypothetical protein